MRTAIIGLILCSYWFASTAQAGALTLQQALLLGMAHNFDLQIASLDVERAEAAVGGEEGRFDLIAELGLGVSRIKSPADSALLADDVLSIETSNAEAALSKQFETGLYARLSVSGEQSDADSTADRLDPAYRTALVLDFTQPLLKDLGKSINTANRDIAQIRKQQAAYGYLAQAQQLAAEIEQAYLDLAEAEASLRYTTLARDLAAELLAGNQRKFDAGLVPITEVYEAKTAMASHEESILVARQQSVLARNRLLELIDHGQTKLPANWQTKLPDREADPAIVLTDALAEGLRQRPDLQQARLELKARKVALVYADNQLLPRLDLEASLGLNGLAGDDETGAAYYDGSWNDAVGNALDRDGNSWYAGLMFSMPLQNSIAKAQHRDAAAQDQQSLYRLRRAEVAAEAAIRSAHTTLDLGKERLSVVHRAAKLAQITLDQENRRLEEGFSDTFRVLAFQNALVAARIREVTAQADYHRAQANLYQAMGTNLERYNIIAALPHQGAMP
jgi:outer membrane protein TolC